LKRLVFFMCALAFLRFEAEAQVAPLWSVPVGETRADLQPLLVDEPVVMPDGGGYFPGSSSGLRASLYLAPDGRRVRGQSYDGSYNDLLATTAVRVLVGQDDVSTWKALQLRDLHGTVLWTVRRVATAARFLADGDVIVLADQQLLRLSATDGTPRWTRHLRDLHPDAEDAYFEFAAVDAQIDLVGSLSLPPGQVSRSERWQLAFDAEDGSTRWGRRGDPDPASTEIEICPPAADGDSVVSVWRVRTAAGYAPEVQRRRRSDGSLIWSVGLDPDPLAWSCDVALHGSRIYLAMNDVEKVRVVAFDPQDGTQVWELVQQQVAEARLGVSAEGDLLLRVLESDGQGGALTRIARHGAAGGAMVWTVNIHSRVVAWRFLADTLRLAWVLEGVDSDQVRVESRDLADGTLLASEADVVTGRWTLAHATGFVGDAACYAQAAADATVTLRCLEGVSALERWTHLLPPPEAGDEVASLWIGALAPGRLGLRTGYRRIVGGTQTVDYRVSALEMATGALAWQRDHLQVAAGWLGSADGGAFLMHGTCASQPGCGGYQALLDRVSGIDGSVLWSRAVSRQPLAEHGGRLFSLLPDILSPVVAAQDVVTGADAWVTPLTPAFINNVSGAVSPSGWPAVKYTSGIGATTRRIEVRGFDPLSGVQRWLTTPTIPNLRTSGGMLVPMTGETFLATGSLTPTTPGGIGSWLAAIDANSGQFRWEQVIAIGRDSSRTVFFAAAGPERVWLGQRRTSSSGLERLALGGLDPDSGQLGGEHQFFSAFPNWINGVNKLPAPRTVLTDGSLLAEDWRMVDGFQLSVLQRWPAPGASGDIVLELGTPSPVLGLGPEAFVELRIENRSGIPVAGVHVGFVPAWSGQSGRVVDCHAQTGQVDCSLAGEYSRPRLDLGAGAAASVRYAVTSPNYRPAQSSDSGTVYFHIDPPYDLGDDLGDNTVEARIWLGGSSNGFE